MSKDPFKSKKDTVKVEKGSVTKTTYTITATTLEEVHNEIQGKGPKIDGKRFAGSTQCILTGFEDGYEFHVEEDKGTFTVTARFDKSKVKFDCLMTLPKYEGYKKLDKEDQKTWLNFYAGVIEHEYEHVADYEQELQKWASEMATLRGEGKAKNEKKANALAQASLGKQYKSQFTAANNKKRLDDTAKKLDAGTGHGPVLKFTISKP